MQTIPRERIRPNDWNVNAFDAEHYPKLVDSIRHKGFMEPLKVTPDPEHPGHYLLVDGYHRWKAAAELGLAELPCEVWEIAPDEAKIRGLQLNYLRGQPVPDRLAGLVHDLNRELSLDDLAAMLPWSVEQLRDSLELLRLPADLQQRVEAEAAEHAARMPIPVTVVLLPHEHEAFEAAMDDARVSIGGAPRRGHLLAHICREYLNRPTGLQPPAIGDGARED
jgi:ParB/RepB/Spo0J family partition protein